MSALADRVTRCVAEQAGVQAASVTPESSFEMDLGMDSLDKIELVVAIEEEFDVMIDDEQAEACKTVGNVVALVEKLAAPAEA